MKRRNAISVAILAFALAGCTSTSGATDGNAGTTAANSPPKAPPAATEKPEKLPAGVLSLIRLDPGSAPAPIAVAFGYVWVGSHRSSTLFRIDPHRDLVSARINLNQDTCGQLVVGAGRLWAGPCDGSTKWIVIDPRTNEVTGSLSINWLYGFASGSGWASTWDDRSVVLFNPVTLRVVRTLPLTSLNGIIAHGYLWLAGGNADDGTYNGVITKVDIRTGKVVGRIHTPAINSSPFFASAPGALWFKGAVDGFMYRIDTTKNRVSRIVIPHYQMPVDYEDAFPTFAKGSMWVRSANGTVSRLNAHTGRLQRTYPADATGAGGYVAVGDGSLWIANFSSDTVWRDKI
jgi:streptogramin lyase